MSKPPSLGSDLEAIHLGWREASRNTTSQHVVSAVIPLVGRFAIIRNQVVKLTTIRDSRGGVTTYRPASASEQDDIDAAILSGTIQIEARSASGALGYASESELMRVYHQATGRRLEG